ncbi:MAG: M50 family metallopeptidase, partial [Synergistaceae bacterium]|nr:M50 family metallopeptidase [Synergistaceae bacterium]
MFISLISFIIVIGVCVIVHEFGHYKTAKMLGVQSHEFAIGMGTVIYQRRDSEGMLWSIRAFPIGGFVRIAGIAGPGEGGDEEGETVKPGMGFNDKPAWKRFLILANGSVMNIILAILLTASILYGHGVLDMQNARIGAIMPGMPAETAGFLPNDKIIEINGRIVNDWREMTKEIRENALIGSVNFKVEREGKIFDIDVVIPVNEESNVPMLGVTPSTKTYTLIESITGAWGYVVGLSIEMLNAIFKLITAKESIDVAGPVGIATMAGQAARAGIWNFITFLALISLNLGLLNLFPF